jgi:hypothetical protein
VFVQHTTSLSIPNSSATLIPFDTEDYDPSGVHSAGLFTVPRAGLWKITLHVAYPTSSSGRRNARVNRNSTTPGTNSLGFQSVAAAAGGETSVLLVTVARLTAGDVLRCWTLQDSGGALNVVTGATANPYALLEYIGG